MAKEEGDIFTDGTSGSLERLIREKSYGCYPHCAMAIEY